MTTSPESSTGFSRIAPGIWFVKGDSAELPADNDPTLIFLFGWMGAQEGPLAKFSAGYKRLYPYSDQIVVSSGGGHCDLAKVYAETMSSARRRSVPISGSDRHLSQGTSDTNACHVKWWCYPAQLPRRNLATPRADLDPVMSAVVLDSLPGGDDLASALHIFGANIPNPIIRHPFFVFMLVLHMVTFFLGRISWRMLDGIRLAASEPDWLPWTGKHTPYLYIYSKGDKSVPYHQVQSHTQVAEVKGQDVTRLAFESSGHISHMKSDPERYWRAVQAVWSKAVSNVQHKAKL